MEKHAKQLHVRMSEEELDRARRLSDALDMTVSDLIRAFIQMTPEDVPTAPGSLIVVDRLTAFKMQREMRCWGYHYNQAVHALNAIAYYLRRDETDAGEVLEELEKVGRKLDAMDEGVTQLRTSVAEIVGHPIARLT